MSAPGFSSSSLLIVLTIAGGVLGNPVGSRSEDGSFTLRIVHTNDMHSRFEQTSKVSSACSKTEVEADKCYGGFARIATLVRQARNSSTPTLFLNAGDTYQGTVWYNVHKWRIVARFLNLLKPDAISLGNHEFDDGVAGLIPFIENATFPIVTANLNLTGEPELAATKLANSTVLEVNGTKIGVIGYLTPDTKVLSKTENVVFLDEVEAISAEAARLKAQGVKILIAVGHSGYSTDKKIAREVADIDLVIGGHTNTFLYSGDRPDKEIPEGYYPTEVVQPSGRKTYVVQAYAYTKYLGNFSVSFDRSGEVSHIAGNPILLDDSVEQATDILDELENWRGAVENLTYTIVGSTRVLLDGDSKNCRRVECNLGNLITDAMIDYNSRQYAGTDGWTDASIAILNGGSIRTSISRDNDDKITMADVLAVLPFGSILVAVTMPGSDILSMLEMSVKTLGMNESTDLAGGFLQFSGLQVTYDLGRPVNSRVVSVYARCASCRVPTYSELKKNATYRVLISDFLYEGGDGYTMLRNLNSTVLGISHADILSEYLQKRSPVYPAVEWRIVYENTVTKSDSGMEKSGSGSDTVGISRWIIATVLLTLWNLRLA